MAAHSSALRAPNLVFPALCRGGVIEAVHSAMLNPTAKNPLDSAHHGPIVPRHEGESIAIAGSTAKPLHILASPLLGERLADQSLQTIQEKFV